MTAKRIVGAVVAGAAAVGLASAAYQAAGEARDRRRNPPPGRLVDVGGYRLHIECVGEGSPPVVICPALGATTGAWRGVQRRVAEETSVYVYDRAGLGYSDSPPRHRTVARMAGELRALLRAADIEPPCVLVGHSMGGLIALAFAGLYPDEVAGLALVDSSHPAMHERLPKVDIRDYRAGTLLIAGLTWGRPLGLMRLAHDLGLGKAPDPGWAQHRRADTAEMLAIRRVCRDADNVAAPLSDLPMAVITSAEIDPNFPPGSHWCIARSRFYSDWVMLQNELAALSTNSRHIVAEHGGHHLNRDNPQLVAQVVIDLVERVRSAAQ